MTGGTAGALFGSLIRRRSRIAAPRRALAVTAAAVAVAALCGGASASAAENGAVGWGENYHGQLGQIFRDNNSVSPVSVEGVTNIKEVAAGTSFNLALLESGEVLAWGGDGHGQLGDDEKLANWEQGLGHVTVKEWKAGAKAPSEFEPLTGVTQVAVGGEHAVALMNDGTVKTWGINQDGALGVGTQGYEVLSSTNETVAHTVEWSSIEKTEKVIVKGKEREYKIKVAEGKLTNIVAVAAGGGSDFAITSEHTVYAWGSDTEGQLGLDLSEPGPEGCKTAVTPGLKREACSTIPRLVEWTNPATHAREPLGEVESIAVGAFSTYALLNDGHVVSWGDDHEGQLGTGAPSKANPGTELPPEEVRLNDGREEVSGEPLSGVVEVVAGYDSAAVRTSREGHREVLGWGEAEQGALSLKPGESGVANCKVTHAEEEEITAKIGEEELAIAKLEEEIAVKRAHGENVEKLQEKLKKDEEKLKQNRERLESLPLQRCVKKATPLARVTALEPARLALGNRFGVALTSHGSVYSWGRNENGELGIGKVPLNTENGSGENVPEAGYPEPQLLSGFGSASAISAGYTHALALIEHASERPAPVVTAAAKHGALELGWATSTSDGAEVLGEHVNYRLSARKGETPLGEGADAGNESGPPVPNLEEPATIAGVEEGANPAVESKGKANTLKVHHGSWGGSRPLTFSYQWERCNPTGEECAKITGEGVPCPSGCASEYSKQVLIPEDVGSTLRAIVIAHNSEGEESEATEATEEVVLTEEEAGKVSEIGRSELTGHNPFEIARTLEVFPFTKEQKEHKLHHHAERECKPLEAKPYELKFTTREVVGSERRKEKSLGIIATPLTPEHEPECESRPAH